MPRVLAIAGSPSRRSRSNTLLAHATERLIALGNDVDHVSLRDFPAEDLLFGRRQGGATRIFVAKVARSDAVVLASPVYKASFSGGFKALLDLLPEDAFQNKVVLPIASAGSLAHLLALEYALKPVLSALGARHILSGVFAHDAQVVAADDEVTGAIAEEIQIRIEDAAVHLHHLLGREAAFRGDRTGAVTTLDLQEQCTV